VLRFSDGGTVPVSGIPTGGEAKAVTFGLREFAWVRFEVEGGTGANVGLSELEVYAQP
jgi:hypothetical protein